jgi:hypothetical protein
MLGKALAAADGILLPRRMNIRSYSKPLPLRFGVSVMPHFPSVSVRRGLAPQWICGEQWRRLYSARA